MTRSMTFGAVAGAIGACVAAQRDVAFVAFIMGALCLVCIMLSKRGT